MFVPPCAQGFSQRLVTGCQMQSLHDVCLGGIPPMCFHAHVAVAMASIVRDALGRLVSIACSCKKLTKITHPSNGTE